MNQWKPPPDEHSSDQIILVHILSLKYSFWLVEKMRIHKIEKSQEALSVSFITQQQRRGRP
jgi:hypothetical protein